MPTAARRSIRTPAPIPMKRRRVAIISSFSRLGQWRGIMRYGQQAGWICQRIDRETLSRLNTWNPDGVVFQIDEFDTPMLDYIRNCKLPKVGLRALPTSCGSTPLVLPDLASFGHQIATHFVARNYRRLCYLGASTSIVTEECNECTGLFISRNTLVLLRNPAVWNCMAGAFPAIHGGSSDSSQSTGSSYASDSRAPIANLKALRALGPC